MVRLAFLHEVWRDFIERI